MNNTTTQKVRDFISSKEFDSWVEDFGKFLGIGWEDERMPQVINFLTQWLITDESLRDLIKKNLNFLDEEKIDAFNDFLNKNYLDKVKELKKEEIKEEETEETLEEREKRYIELMKEILNLSQREEKKEEAKAFTKEKEVIIFEPKERPVEIKKITWEEKEEPKLPEEAIIIKKEEKSNKEDFLDLSKL